MRGLRPIIQHPNKNYSRKNEMKFVKDGRALRSLSEFADIDSRWVDGLRLREQQQPIETISRYVARLERMESEVCYA